MNIDGRAIASEILADAREKMSALARPITVRALCVQPTAATESYLRIKQRRASEAGMHLEVVRLSPDATTEELIEAVQLEADDAVIVQLPLPGHIDTQAVLSAIPLERDADVLSPETYARFAKDEAGALIPPVARAMQEILERSGVAAAGKRAIVIGEGILVGRPCAVLLARMGASVATMTEETWDARALAEADIIVSGAGAAHLVKPGMLSPGVVLIDAGTSESNGAPAGDIDPACADSASVFTPVPGGVGPVAVACLFSNVASLLTK